MNQNPLSSSSFEFFKENEVKNPLAIVGGVNKYSTHWEFSDGSRSGLDSFEWGPGATTRQRPAWSDHDGDLTPPLVDDYPEDYDYFADKNFIIHLA